MPPAPTTPRDVRLEAYSRRQVAVILGVSLPTVDRLIHEKTLRSFKVGRARRIPRQAVEEFLGAGTRQGT